MLNKTLLAGLAGTGMMMLTSTVAALPTYEVTTVSNYWWGRGLNDHGKVVGWNSSAGSTVGFQWEPGKDYGGAQRLERTHPITPEFPNSQVRAWDVNNSGKVAGISGKSTEEGELALTVWDQAGNIKHRINKREFNDLHYSEEGYIYPLYTEVDDPGPEDFYRWNPGSGIEQLTQAEYEEGITEEMTPTEKRTWEILEQHDLPSLIDPSDPHYVEKGEDPLFLADPTEVNGNGQILARGASALTEPFPQNKGTHLLTPVDADEIGDGEPIPAPHTAALFGLGLIGLAGWWRNLA